jgi:hypothetical protein
MVVKTKLFKKYFDKYSTSASQESGPRIGLESNIELPATGIYSTMENFKH